MKRRLPRPEISPICPSGRFGPASPDPQRASWLGTARTFAFATLLIAAASGAQLVSAQVITVDTGGGNGPIADIGPGRPPVFANHAHPR